jgi:hypothetical protein
MGLSNAARNIGLDAVGDVGLYVSLHTADPSTDGSNEVTGGSPAYARQACTWDDAASGSMALAAAETFNVPASTTVTHFGVWSASTSGTFYGGGALSASEEFGAQGTYELGTGTTISIT